MPKIFFVLVLLGLASTPVAASSVMAPADAQFSVPARASGQIDAAVPELDLSPPTTPTSGATALLAEARRSNTVLEQPLQPGAGTAQGANATDPLAHLRMVEPRPAFEFPLASALGLVVLGLGAVTALVRRRRLAGWFGRGAQPPQVNRSGDKSRKRSGRRRH